MRKYLKKKLFILTHSTPDFLKNRFGWENEEELFLFTLWCLAGPVSQIMLFFTLSLLQLSPG
jgi:hypothetical protein